MLDREVVDPAAALLSVAIGMVMEDHAAEAVSLLPPDQHERLARFARLRLAGEDIVLLARAAEVMLKRIDAPSRNDSSSGP